MEIDNSHSLTSASIEIDICSWGQSTIQEGNAIDQRISIVISPSQFRTVLGSSTTSIAFALRILEHTLEQYPMESILVLIADEIQRFSISVFNSMSMKRAQEKALAQGKKIYDAFCEACRQLSPIESEMIEIIRWNDMQTSTDYDYQVEQMKTYVTYNDLRSSQIIEKICQIYARTRNPLKHLNQKNMILLREYVIHELPCLIYGFEYKGKMYTTILHPVLNTKNEEGNELREALADLIDYMKRKLQSESTRLLYFCHIVDVNIPYELIIGNIPIYDSSR